MRKILLPLVLVIFILSSYLWALPLIKGETLSPQKTKSRWGQQTVDFEKFKTSSIEARAPMAFKIMTDKKLIGKSVEDIRNLLGSPDGFYFIDSYPAYLIQEGKSPKEETWQLVFLLNAKYQVREIIVHKNCCDNK